MNYNNTNVIFDIHDPSHSIEGGYWQLRFAKEAVEKNLWQKVSGCINRGLPIKEDSLFRCTKPQSEFELWGCLKWQGNYWVYRHYLTGRDNFNRPGRYFFVLFKLNSIELLNDKNVISILKFLETQVGIPIDINNLNSSINMLPSESSITDQLFSDRSCQNMDLVLSNIIKKIKQMNNEQHNAWVFNQGAMIREYEHLDLPAFTIHKPSPVPICNSKSKPILPEPIKIDPIQNIPNKSHQRSFQLSKLNLILFVFLVLSMVIFVRFYLPTTKKQSDKFDNQYPPGKRDVKISKNPIKTEDKPHVIQKFVGENEEVNAKPKDLNIIKKNEDEIEKNKENIKKQILESDKAIKKQENRISELKKNNTKNKGKEINKSASEIKDLEEKIENLKREKEEKINKWNSENEKLREKNDEIEVKSKKNDSSFKEVKNLEIKEIKTEDLNKSNSEPINTKKEEFK